MHRVFISYSGVDAVSKGSSAASAALHAGGAGRRDGDADPSVIYLLSERLLLPGQAASTGRGKNPEPHH